jgi:hypothetical protein
MWPKYRQVGMTVLDILIGEEEGGALALDAAGAEQNLQVFHKVGRVVGSCHSHLQIEKVEDTFKQCCGFSNFLDLLDPYPSLFVRIRFWIRIRILPSSSKKVKK